MGVNISEGKTCSRFPPPKKMSKKKLAIPRGSLQKDPTILRIGFRAGERMGVNISEECKVTAVKEYSQAYWAAMEKGFRVFKVNDVSVVRMGEPKITYENTKAALEEAFQTGKKWTVTFKINLEPDEDDDEAKEN